MRGGPFNAGFSFHDRKGLVLGGQMGLSFFRRIVSAGFFRTRTRRFWAEVAVCLFLVVFGSFVVVKNATSQICHPGTPCTSVAMGAGASLKSVFPMDIAPALKTAEGTIIAAFTATFTALQAQVTPAMNSARTDIADWLDVMWHFDLKPTLQDVTTQIGGTGEADQSRTVSSFVDAHEQTATQMTHQEHETNDDRKYRENQFACVAGTNMGGMQRARNVRMVLASSMGRAELPRDSNAAGTPAANGPAADQNVRWANYQTRYCNPVANAGNAGCAAAGPFPDADVDVGRSLFAADTVDVRNPDVQRNMDDLFTNIVGPFSEPTVMPNTLGSVEGRETFLRHQAVKAKRQAAREALNYIAARRAPGSRMATFLMPLRAASGVAPSSMSDNPSYEEVMNAMVAERFRSGSYQVDLVDEPENIQRELVMQQAMKVMQLNDQLDLMDRLAIMLAAEVGTEVSKYQAPTAVGATPVQ